MYVVARFRGRNDREVRDDSNAVVTAEGSKNKLVDICMGLNPLSNGTYNFDRCSRRQQTRTWPLTMLSSRCLARCVANGGLGEEENLAD